MEKYKVIKQAISKELVEFIFIYFLNKREVARKLFDSKYISPVNKDWGIFTDEQMPGTYSHFGDVVMETLLAKVKPVLEQNMGLKLNETYSYARIYKKGDILHRHKDRYSCEHSATMNLGGDEWPIFLQPSGEIGTEGIKVLLNPGDMLVYEGCKMEHWREAFEGENCAQVFLHYNDASGKFAEQNKYDKRPFLGLPAWFKNQ